MRGTAPTGVIGITGQVRGLLTRPATRRAVQQTAQRLGIALVVALLWQLTSCSRSASPSVPANPQSPVHSIVRGTMHASPAQAPTGPGLPASVGGSGPTGTGTGSGVSGGAGSPNGSNGSSTSPSGGRCTAPPVIAHRGQGAGIAPLPENTSAAELAAVHQGATLLNVDVRWTSDNVPVAIHDPTLNRTTTGTGPVAGITAARLGALELRTNNGLRVLPGLHPETLATLLAAVKNAGLPVVVQMEADPFSGGAGQASISGLAAVIAVSGYSDRIVVGGWAAKDVRAFSSTAPGIHTAYIQESGNPTAASIRATGARILYIDYARLTAAQVAAWHAGGLAVWAWTPAYVSQWTRLRAIGVDAIATNWVAAYAHWGRPCAPVLPSV